ncbi:MAG: hypothetical protein ACTSVB_07925 [Candidatus Heimdallarchaeaceae archaeon]
MNEWFGKNGKTWLIISYICVNLTWIITYFRRTTTDFFFTGIISALFMLALLCIPSESGDEE